MLFLGYPYLKRFTSLAHLGLGVTWSVAPVAGWLAATGSLTGLGTIGWLWLFSICWVSGFDIIYATLDEAFDRTHGLHSLPARFGAPRALRIAACLHGVALIALWALWHTQLHSLHSFLWLVGVGVLFIWQHAIATRRPAFAFFPLNGLVGCFVFALVLTRSH